MSFRFSIIAASVAMTFASTSMAATPPSLFNAAQDTKLTAPAGITATLAKQQGLSKDHALKVINVSPGQDGNKIVRTVETFKGVRVWGSGKAAVINSKNELVSAKASQSAMKGAPPMSGPPASGAARFEAINAQSKVRSTTAKISAETAITAALSNAPANSVTVTAPTTELIIFPISESRLTKEGALKHPATLNAIDFETVVTSHKLAYIVKTSFIANGKPEMWDSIIDANDGSVIKRISGLHNAISSTTSTVNSIGNSQYSGRVTLQTSYGTGVNPTFGVSVEPKRFYLLDKTRGTGGTYGGFAVVNANNAVVYSGDVFSNTTNIWGDGQQYIPGGSTTNTNGQTAAVNAMWGFRNTYDTMFNVLGWRSLDGMNTATYIAVHGGTALDNAYYSGGCKCMLIGDGSNTSGGFRNLGSLDVIGHEMGHGVTDATSSLIYAGESGGLNESNSDIVGEMVEMYARGGASGSVIPATGADWMIGQELGVNGRPLRYFKKPSMDGRSVDAWYRNLGDIDVHYSSGPNNRMFYFLAQGSSAIPGTETHSSYLKRAPLGMTGIGNDKAFRIWFKANTELFTESTNYVDALNKMVQSATTLYGANSPEVIAVKRAYAAINVGYDIDEVGQGSTLTLNYSPGNQTVTAGKSVTIKIDPQGGSLPYAIKWFSRNIEMPQFSGQTTITFVTTPQMNGSTIFARISDAAGTVVSTVPMTLKVNPYGTLDENIVNSDFELGTVGWKSRSGDIGRYGFFKSPVTHAWLGTWGAGSEDYLYQTLTVPNVSGPVKMTYWLWVQAPPAGTPNDRFYFSVYTADFSSWTTLQSLTSANSTGGYVQQTVDLTAFKGQTVNLVWEVYQTNAVGTAFMIDDVSIKTKPPVDVPPTVK